MRVTFSRAKRSKIGGGSEMLTPPPRSPQPRLLRRTLLLGAVLIGVVVLGACVLHLATEALTRDQAQDMDTCRKEAEHFYHLDKTVDPNDPSSQYIIACMAAKGYDFTSAPADCDTRYPVSTQPACYSPNGWLGWTIDRVRRAVMSK